MKKTIFVLPLCLFFAFCSSSRKAVTPAGPGISNVNVSRADTMTSAAKASASFTAADRDWAYKANKDTSLNGTWTLDGMLASNGSWSSTSTWYQDTSSMVKTDTTMGAVNVGTDATGNRSTGSARSSARSRSNRRNALYDSSKARLKMDYKSTTTLDTTVQPFQYWKRMPSLTINAARQVFTGNTGCNSMSGSFNFSNKDIQFGRNIVTSKMACNEYDERAFLAALKKADNYSLNGNMLEIRQGNTLLLTFKKS
ncbi:MAG: META domain-containing protein [Bacteroidota bacterium]|nr:META domain-containing protein [Bacteroidota bacterium]